MKAVHACVVVVAVLPLALADTNITLLSLPVNLTSWRLSLRQAFNHSLSTNIGGLVDALHGYVEFLKNGSIGCAAKGEECVPGMPSCCPAVKDNDTDLHCLPKGDSFFCGNLMDSSEEAQLRLDGLELGDSMGVLESHPWTNSWEFQSRSAMELEEAQAAEEEKWKKNFRPSSKENIWVQTYLKMKKGGKNLWGDLRKIKKLKEIKEALIDKYKKRMSKTKQSEKDKGESPPESPITYPEEYVENEEGKEKEESEESIIKFSDEIPKREKKIDFRIDDIIKDAVKLVDKKIHKKANQKDKHDKYPHLISPSSQDQRFRLDEIEDTEDQLIRDINELKRLKAQQQRKDEEHKPNEPDIEGMIRKQVSAILEEERKLEKLKKIEELKRLEEGMKQQGEVNL